MTTDKKRACVYISTEILDFCKKYKLGLSDWIETEFFKQFLSIDSKKKQLKQLQQEIAEAEERAKSLKVSLTARERRYICQVTPRLREGKELHSMWRFFNTEYNRDYSLDEFRAMVDFYEKQAVLRVKKAIDMKNAEKR